MIIDASATPEGAPESYDARLNALAAMLDAEDDDAGAESPAPKAKEPDDGDAEQAPVEGDEAEPADKPEETETDEPAKPAIDPATKVTVKINGADVEVTLDEALKGYSRLEDYKAKTAEVAQQGRALESDYANRLQRALETFVSVDPVLSQASTINWTELARTDPGQYVAMQAEVQARREIVTRAQAEVAAARGNETNATLVRERDLLVKADPRFADAATADKTVDDIRAYLSKSYKFDPETLDGLTDHRFVLIADKAAKYDALMAAKSSLPAKIAPATAKAPALKSGNTDAPRSSPRKPSADAPQREQLAWLLKNV
jgi:hypothetical protein